MAKRRNAEIKAIIFDLGEVLVKHKRHVLVGGANFLVASPGKLAWKPKAVKLVEKFELGAISPKQFYKRLRPFMRERISFERFSKEWTSIFEWQPDVAGLLKQLKAAGYKIGIVSNCSVLDYDEIIVKHELKPLIDANATSFKVRARKPERKIFQSALNGLQEKPENCVFIDDVPKYVKAARDLGFKAVQYKNLGQLKTALLRLGVRSHAKKPKLREPRARKRRIFRKRRL